jgi:pimeloyl-ACP methyl ester carboxylesterase
MQKVFIKNRKDQKIVVVLDEAENQKGLAFVMHGLGGFKEQPHIETFADAFKEKGYTVIRFDTTNTNGESDGDLIDATLTNYYEDLEDVINWANGQKFYQEPFILCGHSLGSISVALFAEKYPEKVKALAPTSTVVSGKLMDETPDFKDVAENWKKTGIREWESKSQPGVLKRLKWSHVEDRKKYDLLPEVEKLKMPTILIVGDMDNTTPLDQQKLLYEKLPGKKELHVIKGASHTFTEQEHLAEIKGLLMKWVDYLN